MNLSGGSGKNCERNKITSTSTFTHHQPLLTCDDYDNLDGSVGESQSDF